MILKKNIHIYTDKVVPVFSLKKKSKERSFDLLKIFLADYYLFFI